MKTSLAIPAFALLLLSTAAHGQSPAFEAASIKPAVPSVAEKMAAERMDVAAKSFKIDPGRLTYTNATLRDSIRQAWNLKDYQIEGPKSLAAARFNIVATAGAATPEGQMRLMLRTLLIERFKMSVRMETRELPVFFMTLGNKPKLKPSADDAVFAKGLDGGNLFYRHISMGDFADVLSGFKGIPVLDKTGLTGYYDITLDIFEDPADMKKSMIRGDFGDVAAATVQSQLGLRLEPRKSPIPILIVDQAEKTPIEN